MADRDVKIGIVTTADTSGVDRAVTAIDRLTGVERERGMQQNDLLTAEERERAEIERMVASSQKLIAAREEEARSMAAMAEAARKEQAALDVVEAKRRLAARGAKDHSAAVANLGTVAQQVGFQVTDFATQVSMGTSAFVAFAQQAPQAIGAVQQFGQGMKLSLSSAVSLGTGIGLIATEVGIGLQYLSSIWAQIDDEQKKARQSAEEYRQAQENLKTAAKNLRETLRAEFIAANFKEEADELERQVRAMERLNELRGAQSGAAEAQAAAGVAAAQSSGGDVTGAKVNQIEVGVNSQLGSLQAKLQESDAAVDKATQALDQATIAQNEAGRRFGAFSQEFEDADKAMDAARSKLESAKLDQQNLEKIIEAEKLKIEANAQASLTGLSDEVTQSTDAKAKELVEKTKSEITQLVDASGGKVSADFAEAAKRFQTITTDSIPDAQQMDQIAALIRNMRQSQSAMLTGMVDDFGQMLTLAEQLTAARAADSARLDRLASFISQVTGTEL